MTNTHAIALAEDGMTFEIHKATCPCLKRKYFADLPHFVTAPNGQAAADNFQSGLAEDQQGFKFEVYPCA